jgi:hypothetical protein
MDEARARRFFAVLLRAMAMLEAWIRDEFKIERKCKKCGNVV